MAAAARPGGLVHLTEADVEPFLAEQAGLVVVDVSATWCTPCQLLAPVLRKLAMEFADRLTVAEIDGELGVAFAAKHGVDSYPQLLFFRRGRLVRREQGFHSVEAVAKSFMQALGINPDGELSKAERRFRDAQMTAQSRFQGAGESAYVEVQPYFRSIEPEMDRLEALYRQERGAGRLDEAEMQARLRADYDRLCAPFADKIAAWRAVLKAAMSEYQATMEAEVRRFTATIGASALRPPAAATCRPGDPSCTMAR